MDDIKRALLGNHEAAKRLTEAGVLLPCPFCGSTKVKVRRRGVIAGKNGLGYMVENHAYSVRCNVCHARGPLKSGKVVPPFPFIQDKPRDIPSWATTDCVLSYRARLAWNTRAPILSESELKKLEENT